MGSSTRRHRRRLTATCQVGPITVPTQGASGRARPLVIVHLALVTYHPNSLGSDHPEARRLPTDPFERLVALPVPNPSDVAFGGPRRDRLYLTSIAVDIGDGPPPEDARSLMVQDGLGVEGMPEHRFEL